MRPCLEYCTTVFNPYLHKDINLLESVQRRFTSRIPGLNQLDYSERLKVLNLESLELRRLRYDLVECFKIGNGLSVLNFNSFFTYSNNSHTRGHPFKLYANRFTHDCCKNFFANRVISYWNKHCWTFVTPSIGRFKYLLNFVLPNL